MTLTGSQKASATRAAQSIGVPVEWLLAVIQNESGGNPAAKNPKSSARGLIQFVDATAKSLGYASSLALVNQNPTFEEQVEGPVVDYFNLYAPFYDRDSFIGSVFYPAYRSTPYKALPANVQAVNPGITTLHGYVESVWAHYKGIKLVEDAFPWIFAGGLTWVLWRKYKKLPLIPKMR